MVRVRSDSVKKLIVRGTEHGLILQTLRPFNVYILLNGWICLHGVLD